MSETSLESNPNSFVHLHLHAVFTFRWSNPLKDLIPTAKEMGVPAIAQTDHGNMFGAIDFYIRCQEAGIKPILGSEVYFTPGSRHEHFSKKSKNNW